MPRAPEFIIAVGPRVHRETGQVTGQAMMFELVVGLLQERGVKVSTYDLTEHPGPKPRTDSTFTLRRMAEVLSLLPGVWLALCTRRGLFYLTGAQSRVGFLRDALMILPARLTGHTVAVHQFGGNYDRFYEAQGPLFRWLIRLALNCVHVLLVEGELTRAHFAFLPRWRERVKAVPNGLPERRIAPNPTAKSYDPARPMRLLFLSNMFETKGCWDVLEAVRILRQKEGRDVTCRFVGRWLAANDSFRYPDPARAREDFFASLDAHGLGEAVTHETGLFDEEKAAAFAEAHLFLLPSNYMNEGQPVSILEAMAHGVPVIATAYRLIPSMVVDGETGYFVPYGDPRAIAARVGELMDDPARYARLSAGSLARFRELFSPERYGDRLVAALAASGA